MIMESPQLILKWSRIGKKIDLFLLNG
ncbi:BnaC02g31460D [Brassica napus]|uniref:BnaC02g31460D protein n=1 Tax=Brassica napus TaxID=3708 RepID=A0A078HED8_BRANA|nr:BnaC02g31460D [Brassica napus]